MAFRAKIMGTLRNAIATRNRGELAEALRRQGVPAGEVLTVEEVLTDPHMVDREVVKTFEHPVEGPFPYVRPPVPFTEHQEPGVAAPPILGNCTKEVLRHRLQLNTDDLNALEEDGVI